MSNGKRCTSGIASICFWTASGNTVPAGCSCSCNQRSVPTSRRCAALDALTRRTMQDELLRLWDDTKFTVLFVTHSINEAIKVGNRILLLSPHPGQVRAELDSLPREAPDPAAMLGLETKIHDMLFA